VGFGLRIPAPRDEARAADFARGEDSLGDPAPGGPDRHPSESSDVAGAQIFRGLSHFRAPDRGACCQMAQAPGRQIRGQPDAPANARAQSAHRAPQIGQQMVNRVVA